MLFVSQIGNIVCKVYVFGRALQGYKLPMHQCQVHPKVIDGFNALITKDYNASICLMSTTWRYPVE